MAATENYAPSELAKLLERVATQLPGLAIVVVLRTFPVVELARLACVHKAFRVAWQSLQQQHPGPRYAPPTARAIKSVQEHSRLVRAGCYGDVAVIQFMLAAGVDEHGTSLLQAREFFGLLQLAARAVDAALYFASQEGRADVVSLLIQHGADVHALKDQALMSASMNGHADVVSLLIQHGADVHALKDQALMLASANGHADVVALLIQHGANVRTQRSGALQMASLNGHTAVIQLLLQHGALRLADMHAV